MKRSMCVLLIILMLSCLTSCENLDTSDAIDPEERCKSKIVNLMDSFMNQSTKVLENELCQQLYIKHDNIEDEIKRFNKFIDGSIVSYDEPSTEGGGKNSNWGTIEKRDYIILVSNIKTDKGKYYNMVIYYYDANVFCPEQLGIYNIIISHADAVKDEVTGEYPKGQFAEICLSEEEQTIEPVSIQSDFSETDVDSEWELKNGVIFHNAKKVHQIPEYDQGDNPGDACFMDSDHAYLSYFSIETSEIIVEYTDDGGKTWEKTAFHGNTTSIYKSSVYVYFIDQNTGFVLYRSGASEYAGDESALYKTMDGGRNFKRISEIHYLYEDGIVDFAFSSEKDGIILLNGAYNDETYAIRTKNGGKKWKQYSVDEELTSEYLNQNYLSGCFIGREHMESNKWIIKVLKVQDVKAEYHYYYSDDDWETWKKRK